MTITATRRGTRRTPRRRCPPDSAKCHRRLEAASVRPFAASCCLLVNRFPAACLPVAPVRDRLSARAPGQLRAQRVPWTAPHGRASIARSDRIDEIPTARVGDRSDGSSRVNAIALPEGGRYADSLIHQPHVTRRLSTPTSSGAPNYLCHALRDLNANRDTCPDPCGRDGRARARPRASAGTRRLLGQLRNWRRLPHIQGRVSGLSDARRRDVALPANGWHCEPAAPRRWRDHRLDAARQPTLFHPGRLRTMGPVALFYPSANGAFFVKGGIGVATARIVAPPFQATRGKRLVSDPRHCVEPACGARISPSPQVRLFTSHVDAGSSANLSLGLGFTWP